MDFVADQLADGRKIRTLTIVDLFTRECLGIEVGFSLRADHVVAAMNRLKYDRGLPERITTDNGSEFAGSQMDLWALEHHWCKLLETRRYGAVGLHPATSKSASVFTFALS